MARGWNLPGRGLRPEAIRALGRRHAEMRRLREWQRRRVSDATRRKWQRKCKRKCPVTDRRLQL
jgi:hypothetical protein